MEDDFFTMELPQSEFYAYDGSRHHADVALSYSKLDPYEATIIIVHDNTLTPVVWSIARDLFSEAIRGKRPDKGADVEVSSDSNRVFMKLCPPGSRPVTFHFYVEDISRFLSESYKIVPKGQENVEGQIEEISKFLYQWPDA